MLKWIETTGRSEEDAITAALFQLGLDRDDVSVEVIERAKSGFLGFGSNPAKVRVSYNEVDGVPRPITDEPAVEKPAPKVGKPAPAEETVLPAAKPVMREIPAAKLEESPPPWRRRLSSPPSPAWLHPGPASPGLSAGNAPAGRIGCRRGTRC